MKTTKILILGKTPPPIGGITNHVGRLVENLPKQNFNNFNFCDLGKESIRNIILAILRHRIIHLHVSRPWIQALFACFCRISAKTLILTYHGNWGRYGRLGNGFVSLSAWLATVPIVQNESSFTKAVLLNPNSLLISTFLPPLDTSPIDQDIFQVLKVFREKYEIVLCSNAWNVTFDKNGKETYGISDMIRRIQQSAEIGLILSDPSGNYQQFLNKLFGHIPENVVLITTPHDFRHVLSVSDAFVRNTTTDGISLSIYEARELHVPILASSAVVRPAFCKVYDAIEKIEFREEIRQARNLLMEGDASDTGKKALEELLRLYTSFVQGEFTGLGSPKKTKA